MKYIVANWKMNMDTKEINNWFKEWEQLDAVTEVIPIIAPSSIHIKTVADLDDIELASQDISIFDKGAHTGNIGNFQIKEYCDYSIVGHSERRENLETVTEKVKRCLEHNITPLVCFSDKNNVADYLFEGGYLVWEDPNNISVEGKYREKDPNEIKRVFEEFEKLLPTKTKILYGGSVNRKNIASLKEIARLDGVLVGNASLDAKHFYDLCTGII